MNRKPITNIQKPIIVPMLYNNRSSSCPVNSVISDKSLYEVIDCNNNKFVYINKFTNVSRRVIDTYLSTAESDSYFYINVNKLNNLEFVDWSVNKIVAKDFPVYLETDRNIKESTLVNLGKNPFNIIQCDLSQLSDMKEDYYSNEEYLRIQEFRSLPARIKTYGLYSILNIGPIIPQVTQLKNILLLLNAQKNSYNHIIINFIKIPKKPKEDEDYIVYKINGKEFKIDSDYFELQDNIWVCADWYKQAIIKNIKYLARGTTVSICGNCANCRGISLLH